MGRFSGGLFIVGSAGFAHVVDTRGLIPISYFLYIDVSHDPALGLDGIAWIAWLDNCRTR
jgi:hypothetical protein